ncbi:hypothetical protein CR513_14893, partial [Mucuna pruriens]
MNFVLQKQMEVSTFMKGFSLRTKNSLVKELLIKEAHESGVMGYFGKYKTYKTLLKHFFWWHMKCDVHSYAKSKVQPHGHYTPMPVPSMPWVDISMDFILG